MSHRSSDRRRGSDAHGHLEPKALPSQVAAPRPGRLHAGSRRAPGAASDRSPLWTVVGTAGDQWRCGRSPPRPTSPSATIY